MTLHCPRAGPRAGAWPPRASSPSTGFLPLVRASCCVTLVSLRTSCRNPGDTLPALGAAGPEGPRPLRAARRRVPWKPLFSARCSRRPECWLRNGPWATREGCSHLCFSPAQRLGPRSTRRRATSPSLHRAAPAFPGRGMPAVCPESWTFWGPRMRTRHSPWLQGASDPRGGRWRPGGADRAARWRCVPGGDRRGCSAPLKTDTQDVVQAWGSPGRWTAPRGRARVPQDVRGGSGAPGKVAVSPRAAGRGEGALGQLPSWPLAGRRRRRGQRGTLPPSRKDARAVRAVSRWREEGAWQAGAGRRPVPPSSRGLGPRARSPGPWHGVRRAWTSTSSQRTRISPAPPSP